MKFYIGSLILVVFLLRNHPRVNADHILDTDSLSDSKNPKYISVTEITSLMYKELIPKPELAPPIDKTSAPTPRYILNNPCLGE